MTIVLARVFMPKILVQALYSHTLQTISFFHVFTDHQFLSCANECTYLEVNKTMIKDIHVHCALGKVRVLRFRDII